MIGKVRPTSRPHTTLIGLLVLAVVVGLGGCASNDAPTATESATTGAEAASGSAAAYTVDGLMSLMDGSAQYRTLSEQFGTTLMQGVEITHEEVLADIDAVSLDALANKTSYRDIEASVPSDAEIASQGIDMSIDPIYVKVTYIDEVQAQEEPDQYGKTVYNYAHLDKIYTKTDGTYYSMLFDGR